MARYAIYFCPAAASPLWCFGSGVLGYDSAAGVAVPHPAGPPEIAGDKASADDFARWTRTPRVYGFHATLKAPFELKGGFQERDIVNRAAEFAMARAAVPLGRLRVASLGRFIALVANDAAPALQGFASACVDGFETLRAPLSEHDRKRRLATDLTDKQIALLDRYGYPHVHDAFRFHMTLTGPLDSTEQRQAQACLAALYAPIDEPVMIDAITLGKQPQRDAPFVQLARFALGNDAPQSR